MHGYCPRSGERTRAEVKAELAEAIRNGDMVADSETGATFRQLYPSRYPATTVAAGKTRAEVKLCRARR